MIQSVHLSGQIIIFSLPLRLVSEKNIGLYLIPLFVNKPTFKRKQPTDELQRSNGSGQLLNSNAQTEAASRLSSNAQAEAANH